jgi:hypothetical protein
MCALRISKAIVILVLFCIGGFIQNGFAQGGLNLALPTPEKDPAHTAPAKGPDLQSGLIRNEVPAGYQRSQICSDGIRSTEYLNTEFGTFYKCDRSAKNMIPRDRNEPPNRDRDGRIPLTPNVPGSSFNFSGSATR